MNKKKKLSIGWIISIIILTISIVAVTVFIWVNAVLSKPKGEAARIPADPLLILVNSEYHIPAGYDVKLMELSNGQKIDERIYPDLQQMFDDMRALEYSPYVREGYRTGKEQKEILVDRIVDFIQAGYSPIKAFKLARSEVAAVGNSEHQLGLAVDINPYSGSPNEWGVYSWLDENAWQYGFILRYPDGKTDVTGITYEPWHYRYVGKEAAKEIHSRGITLEEYILNE
ncbi:MAG: M15 family metallopeptidase [Oscillospiraceae bacterium]